MLECLRSILVDSVMFPFQRKIWNHEKALNKGRQVAEAIRLDKDVLAHPPVDTSPINDPRFPKPVCLHAEQRISQLVRSGRTFGPFVIDPVVKRIVGVHTRMNVYGLDAWGGPALVNTHVLIKNPLRKNERALHYSYGSQNVTVIHDDRVYLGELTRQGAVILRPAVDSYQHTIRTHMESLPKRIFRLK